MTDSPLIQCVISQSNALSLFWERVRNDKIRGYAPAGQVNPPPQPYKKLAEAHA